MRAYIFLLAFVRLVQCYSSGQVTGSCEDMIPGHGPSTQTTPVPFSVTTNQTSYQEGDEITVLLQAESTPFTGFLLQAREDGGNSPVGSFTMSGDEAQLLACDGQSNSAVSHKSNSPKRTIQSTWKAPTSGNLKHIEFSVTFVRNFSTFWVGVRSPQVNYSNSRLPVKSTDAPQTTSLTESTSTPNPSSTPISSVGCGIRKVCFSRPNNCDPAISSDCFFMSAMTSPEDSAIKFEISGPSQGYVSTGFSDDQQMGNDDIYICGKDNNGIIQVQHAFSTGRRAPEILPLGNVSQIKTSLSDGVISCSFTSRNPISAQRSAGSLYFLFFAHGLTNNGRIQFHTTPPFISEDKVDISSPQLVTNANRPQIIKAHGALMLIAWMTTGSLGMIIARYMKAVAKGSGCSGKDFWFLAHVSLMSLSVVATIIAFILVFAHVKGWSGGAHPVLGCLVMTLALIQPAAAAFRCGPQHKWRFIFNWSHALNAVAIKGLAVAAIFTGLSLIDSFQDKFLLKVMGGFVGWEALSYILQDVHRRRKRKDEEENVFESISVESILLILFFLGNLAFLVALLVGIGMS